jgi:hypothetical protein
MKWYSIRKLRVMLKLICHRPEDHLHHSDIKRMHKRDLIQRKLRVLAWEEAEKNGGPQVMDVNREFEGLWRLHR